MIDLGNFTTQERHQLAEIRARVRLQKPYRHIEQLQEENKRLRRLVLELITCILHGRRPNEEAMREINQVLRLEKLR